MSLTRRSLLGALAALVAAPAAAIAAKDSAPKLTLETIEQAKAQVRRMHPIGSEVRQAVRIHADIGNTEQAVLHAMRSLEAWGEKFRCRRVGPFRREAWNFGRILAVTATFVQE